MTDIVERLRALVILDEVGSDNPLGREAADEIARLRAALRRIADGAVDDDLKGRADILSGIAWAALNEGP